MAGNKEDLGWGNQKMSRKELRWRIKEVRQEEEVRQRNRQLLREEEEEDREMREYDIRLEDMLESCTEYDRSIQDLIDEQREMLSAFRMRRRELYL